MFFLLFTQSFLGLFRTSCTTNRKVNLQEVSPKDVNTLVAFGLWTFCLTECSSKPILAQKNILQNLLEAIVDFVDKLKSCIVSLLSFFFFSTSPLKGASMRQI